MPSAKTKKKVKPFRDREMEKSLYEAAEIGIAVLRKYHRKLKSVEKKGTVDLVTQADREAERVVLDYLRRRHPEHTMIGEETFKGDAVAPAGFAWVLDPVDGTTNYAHGLDHYALSLALIHDGVPVAGVVVDPERDHTYNAILGRGAFRNRERLRVSPHSKLVESIIATGFPYDRGKRLTELTTVIGEILKRAQGIRRYGVASMDLALVAAGQFDGYYESPLKVWDIAAGVLLVEEAGGCVTDYGGRKLDLFRPSVVATNGLIHSALTRVMRDTYKRLGVRVPGV